jgi:ectoine hydroxylase-related dioxygenase (phytanoyl-CoA dioxygenase family)
MTAAPALAPAPALTAEQAARFRREGYVILPRYMPAEVLAAVRADCDAEIARRDAEMEAKGLTVDGITHYKRRYFLENSYVRHEAVRRWVFSPEMAAVARAALGDTAQLFLEQFVVKGCDAGSKFGWHQDSGYVGYPHREYLTCWIALDDVSEANGTISVLPFGRSGADPHLVPRHLKEAGTNDMIGYHGEDPGEPVVIPAGSLVMFSSHLFHRSGPNNTHALRRAWLIQYTAEPMHKPDGSLQILAVPFLQDGRIVSGG